MALTYRDVSVSEPGVSPAPGKQYVVTIGIDHYKSADRLHNAVGDALGVSKAFERLGFEPVCSPILDDEATNVRLTRLVDKDLRALGTNDSLVVFFAGHGHIHKTPQANQKPARTGYLLPVDAVWTKAGLEGGIRADAWLSDIARLSPRHIFVVLDACHSGMTLDEIMHYRGGEPRLPEPIEILRTRRSRRVITSALDDQLALDNGPIQGHSLFTGCLIQALDGGVFVRERRSVATASEICSLVRSRVIEFPNSKQTPDSGVLELHEHGELVVELPGSRHLRRGAGTLRPRSEVGIAILDPHAPQTVGAVVIRPNNGLRGAFDHAAPRLNQPKQSDSKTDNAHDRRRMALDATFITAMTRHTRARQVGGKSIALVTADPRWALHGWAMWSAHQGCVTLTTRATSVEGASNELLSQAPWARVLAAARRKLANAARLTARDVDAALDARTTTERLSWINSIGGRDLLAHVSGELLSAIREDRANLLSGQSMLAKGPHLVSALADLGLPFSVLFHHPEATTEWLTAATRAAVDLSSSLPAQAIAITAPAAMEAHLRAQVGADPPYSRIPLAMHSATTAAEEHDVVAVLKDALANETRTKHHSFASTEVSIHGVERVAHVDLASRTALVAVGIDLVQQMTALRTLRERAKDIALQQSGYFVMRYVAEDIQARLPTVVDEIAAAITYRRVAIRRPGTPQ